MSSIRITYLFTSVSKWEILAIFEFYIYRAKWMLLKSNDNARKLFPYNANSDLAVKANKT